jgi:phage terminase large subunit-like protein
VVLTLAPTLTKSPQRAVQPRGASTRKPKVLAPFTVAHFRHWASDVILDTGQSWHPEPFQEAFVEDLFAGTPECWLIVPEGNGKTTLLAGLALYHCEHRPFAQVPVAAASREQAEIMYRQAEGMVLSSPRLHASVHSDIQAAKGKRKTEVPAFTCLEGYRRINHHAGGRIQVFAADDRTGDGVIPTLGVIDEPHRQRNLSLYRTWSGKVTKRGGQLVAISTRGEPGSDFELTLARIHEAADETATEGSFTRVRSGRVVLHEWAVPKEADERDIPTVKAANPFSGVTTDLLAEKMASPTMTPNHWLRFVCNRPALDFDNWLGPNGAQIWADLADPWTLIRKARTWVGIDVGQTRDSTAVVTAQVRPDEPDKPPNRIHLHCRLWMPQKDRPVPLDEVAQYVRDLCDLYMVDAVSYDPRLFDVRAEELEDEGYPMVKIPQSLERMTMACGDLYAGIMGGTITHDGDPAFTTQVMNAQPRFNERGFTLAKAKSTGRIDAAIAAALAVDRVMRAEPWGSVYEDRPMRELG